ncbi:hypothetical protein EDD22DRAFT_623721 [Suillus occidentalis]|nr:hypothetical protein EDD22DRAFT_623721 [Suillus occidentalis]
MCGTRLPWLLLKLMTPNAIHSLSLSASRQTKFVDWHTRFDIPCDVLQVRFAGVFCVKTMANTKISCLGDRKCITSNPRSLLEHILIFSAERTCNVTQPNRRDIGLTSIHRCGPPGIRCLTSVYG